MPSVSKPQHNFMAAIAHSPEFARKAGVPQSVGKDFYKADQSAHKYAGGGNVSIYGGGERIRAPEATIMGGSGNKHIRTGQAFRPRWGAKPMGFAKGGTVEIKEVDDGNPFHRMVENLDQVTHSYHPDFGRGTPWPNRMIPQANIQWGQIPSAPGSMTGTQVPMGAAPARGAMPRSQYMADGGSVDSIPTGPITQDTMKTLGNGVGSWRDIPDAAMQAVIGAVQHGAGAGGDIEKMFYPREPNVLPSSSDMGKILPGASSSDTAPWRNIGGSMPVGPGTLMKGASVLPFLGARGMKVAPATIEDFRQAMLGFERRGAPKVANNASGESAASLEAINRNTQENAQKIQRFMVNKNSGEVRPINMVDRADRVPAPDEVHVVMQPGNKPYVWSQGGNVKNDETQGVINRMLYNMGHKD